MKSKSARLVRISEGGVIIAFSMIVLGAVLGGVSSSVVSIVGGLTLLVSGLVMIYGGSSAPE